MQVKRLFLYIVAVTCVLVLTVPGATKEKSYRWLSIGKFVGTEQPYEKIRLRMEKLGNDSSNTDRGKWALRTYSVALPLARKGNLSSVLEAGYGAFYYSKYAQADRSERLRLVSQMNSLLDDQKAIPSNYEFTRLRFLLESRDVGLYPSRVFEIGKMLLRKRPADPEVEMQNFDLMLTWGSQSPGFKLAECKKLQKRYPEKDFRRRLAYAHMLLGNIGNRNSRQSEIGIYKDLISEKIAKKNRSLREREELATLQRLLSVAESVQKKYPNQASL